MAKKTSSPAHVVVEAKAHISSAMAAPAGSAERLHAMALAANFLVYSLPSCIRDWRSWESVVSDARASENTLRRYPENVHLQAGNAEVERDARASLLGLQEIMEKLRDLTHELSRLVDGELMATAPELRRTRQWHWPVKGCPSEDIVPWLENVHDAAARLADMPAPITLNPKSVLSDKELQVWNSLQGKRLTSKELAKLDEEVSEDGIRQRIKAIRHKLGYKTILTVSDGYIRPDAPPA